MENRLRELCAENLEMQEKYYLYCEIKKELSERLSTVPTHFPHFSLHDGSHSANIIKYLSQLLGAVNIKKLSVSDLFIVCVASYAHDISMAVSYEMIYKTMSSDDWKNNLEQYTRSEQEDLAAVAERLLRFPELKEDVKALDIYSDVSYIVEEIFRIQHAKRSAEEILVNDQLEKMFGIRIRNILAEVCRLHGCNVSDIMELPYEENGIFDDYIHPRFDAALLALGDLLDMDTERFDKNFLNAAAPMLELSAIHKEKHESITHFLVKDGTIEIKSNCKRIEVYRAMRDWGEWIKQITEFMSINWNRIAPVEIGGAPSLGQYEILLNNDTKWLEFADTKFGITTRHALKLLGSTVLYKSKYTFVRELIQNAVDATMKRVYLEYIEQGNKKDDKLFLEWIIRNIKEIDNLQINVAISIEGEFVKFVIEDKGCGITKEDIKRIANVEGKSESEREFIQLMPEFFRPSGTFGIGLQSVFSVADYFEAITRTEAEETKKITFQDAKDGRGYINVEDCERRNSIGTTVTVLLNPNRFTQEDLSVNDYAFKVYPKEQLIYWDIISKVNNIHSAVPAIAARQERKEYIPVVVECLEEIEEIPAVPKRILEYTCLFKDDIFAQDDYRRIECKNSSILYEYYDIEYGCIFQAFLNPSYIEGEILRSIVQLADYYNYENIIFYRNSYVESGYRVGFDYERDSSYRCIDYSINLLSCNSEEILTLERKGVKDSFKSRLDNLISTEADKCIKYIVDYLIKTDVNISSSLLFVVYQAAKNLQYKDKLLSEKYKNGLKKLKIGGYRKFNVENTEDIDKMEVHFYAYDLINKKLYFARKCEDADIAPDAFDISKTVNENELLDLDAKSAFSHPINHKIKESFIYKVDGIPCEIFVAEPYRKQGDEPYERDIYFKRKQFLEIMFGNRRCIEAWPRYEALQTGINSGSRNHGTRVEKEIEMGISAEILEKMAAELNEKGYIADCCKRFLKPIEDSAKYKTNLQYILNESKKEEKSIIKKYKEFWKEELTLLEDNNLAAFTINEAKRLKDRVSHGGFISTEEPYGKYFVK